MSNFLKKILSSKSSSKDLTQKEIEEQHIAFSSESDVTNESIHIAKIENDFLNWEFPTLIQKQFIFKILSISEKIFVQKL